MDIVKEVGSSPTPQDCAYAAGIVDADGHIGGTLLRYARCHPSGTPHVLVRVSTKDEIIAPWLAEKFGGKLYLHRANGTNVWEAAGSKAGPFLQAILPYLKLKRPQAELVLALLSVAVKKGRDQISDDIRLIRIRIIQEIQELNKLTRKNQDVA